MLSWSTGESSFKTSTSSSLLLNPDQLQGHRSSNVSHVFTPVPEHFYLPPWPTTVHRGSVCTCRLCVNMRVCLRNLPLVNVTQPLGKETFPPFYSRWPRHLWKSLRCFWAQGHYWTRWTQSCKSIETGSSVCCCIFVTNRGPHFKHKKAYIWDMNYTIQQFTFCLCFSNFSASLVGFFSTFSSFIYPIIVYFASARGGCFAFKSFGLDSVSVPSAKINSVPLCETQTHSTERILSFSHPQPLKAFQFQFHFSPSLPSFVFMKNRFIRLALLSLSRKHDNFNSVSYTSTLWKGEVYSIVNAKYLTYQ